MIKAKSIIGILVRLTCYTFSYISIISSERVTICGNDQQSNRPENLTIVYTFVRQTKQKKNTQIDKKLTEILNFKELCSKLLCRSATFIVRKLPIISRDSNSQER